LKYDSVQKAAPAASVIESSAPPRSCSPSSQTRILVAIQPPDSPADNKYEPPYVSVNYCREPEKVDVDEDAELTQLLQAQFDSVGVPNAPLRVFDREQAVSKKEEQKMVANRQVVMH
jgi:hypothetical protein